MYKIIFLLTLFNIDKEFFTTYVHILFRTVQWQSNERLLVDDLAAASKCNSYGHQHYGKWKGKYLIEISRLCVYSDGWLFMQPPAVNIFPYELLTAICDIKFNRKYIAFSKKLFWLIWIKLVTVQRPRWLHLYKSDFRYNNRCYYFSVIIAALFIKYKWYNFRDFEVILDL